jgi:hypothetical protein
MLPCVVKASWAILDASSEKEKLLDTVIFYVNFCDKISNRSDVESIDKLFNLDEKDEFLYSKNLVINAMHAEQYAQVIYRRTQRGEIDADFVTSCGAVVCLLILSGSIRFGERFYEAADRAKRFHHFANSMREFMT